MSNTIPSKADKTETWTIYWHQNYAIHKVVISHLNATKAVWFISNKYYPSKKLGTDACIGSIITTVIERAYQINYNWYNALFAASK